MKSKSELGIFPAEEVKKCQEAEEAEKREHKAAEAWCWKEAAEAERQWEAERWREAERQREAKKAKEAKKQQCAKSEAGPSSSQGTKCIQCMKAGAMWIMGLGMKRKVACDCVQETTSLWGGEKKKRMRRAWPIVNDDDDDDDTVVMSTCKARKLESGVRETMAQVVDRRMGKVVKELWGLRKGVATMAESNWDLAWVLYCGFQSVDTLLNGVQIFGAEGFLPKLAPESEPAKDKLQDTLREVEELQEEHLEWAMECLQMQKEWMQQEEAALTKCLKGKGKELVREEEQEGEEQGEEEQGTRGEEKEGEAE
ncbi:hypothetical protein ID866_10780 [Astraeus odoratus]|nr:hypothetical protein ID866_10780 [Astraeus odoratus]